MSAIASSAPSALVVQRSDPAAASGLAARALAAAITGQPLWLLLRLDGTALLRPAAAWPQPSDELHAWLHAQEFPDLKTYLDMALDAAAARRCVCTESLTAWGIADPGPVWKRMGLAGFVAEAQAAGASVAWLV